MRNSGLLKSDTQEISRPLVIRRPQAIAWIILVISFMLFLVICGLGTFGTYYFLFESSVHLTVNLTVSRGVVGVALADQSTNVSAPNYEQEIQTNSILQVSSDSQGYLQFEDNTTKAILATVTMLPNSVVMLDDTTHPRFQWSQSHNEIWLANVSGNLAIDIPSQSSQNIPMALHIISSAGSVLLTQSGSYTVNATDKQIQLNATYGQGVIYQRPDHAAQVLAGSYGTVTANQDYPVVKPIMQDTIMSFGYDSPIPDGHMPTLWGCQNEQPNNTNEPEGQWETHPFNQQIVLEMSRSGEGDLNHAETECFNVANSDSSDPQKNPGIMVLDTYKSLNIQARLRINAQDVATCGIEASECPIMLELIYQDRDGHTDTWHQGFYALRPANDTSLIRCDTCPSVHEQINPNTWFIYDSGNLLLQLTGANQPTFIKQVRVYASGHRWDVAIADFALLGRKE